MDVYVTEWIYMIKIDVSKIQWQIWDQQRVWTFIIIYTMFIFLSTINLHMKWRSKPGIDYNFIFNLVICCYIWLYLLYWYCPVLHYLQMKQDVNIFTFIISIVTHCDLMTPYEGIYIWVSIVNGLPEGINPLPEPTLTYHEVVKFCTSLNIRFLPNVRWIIEDIAY